MCFIRSFDCYAGVITTVKVHFSIITDFQWGKFTSEGLSNLGLKTADYIVVGIGILILFTASFMKSKTGGIREWLSTKSMPVRWTVYGVLFFGIIVFGVYGFGYDSRGFIYTQFG
jgi:hypothetical protein